MHDREARKLRLSVTTVRPLAEDELRDIVGGVDPITYSVIFTMCNCSSDACPATDTCMTRYPPCDPNHTNLCPISG